MSKTIIGLSRMNLSRIPVVKLPIINLTTDPLDVLVAAIVLRMKQLAKTNPKFIELSHDRQIRLQISTQAGMSRQIIVNEGKIDTAVGTPQLADLVLTFKDSDHGVKTLMKGEPSAFMTGIQDGSIKMEGDFSLLVWFSKVARLLPPKLPSALDSKVKRVRAFIRKKMG